MSSMAAYSTPPGDNSIVKRIEETVRTVIDKLIEEEVAAAVEEAKRRVEAKIPQIVAGVALAVYKTVNIKSCYGGSEILISVALVDKRETK